MRTLLRAIVLAATTGFLVVPALVSSTASAPAAGLAATPPISERRADLVVTADGTLAVKETLTVEHRDGDRGVTRTWDLRDPRDPTARLVPEDVSARLDDRETQVELGWARGRRLRVATIGDPDASLPAGRHTYTLTYSVRGALSSVPDRPGRSELHWWVRGGWGAATARSTVRLVLPVAADRVRCSSPGAAPCAVSGVGTDALTASTGSRLPRDPVALRVQLPMPTPDRVTAPWPVQLDRALGRSLLALLGILAATLALALVGRVLERRGSTAARAVVAASLLALLVVGTAAHPPVSAYLLPLAGLATGGAGLLVRRR